jgi:hypothetical protein
MGIADDGHEVRFGVRGGRPHGPGLEVCATRTAAIPMPRNTQGLPLPRSFSIGRPLSSVVTMSRWDYEAGLAVFGPLVNARRDPAMRRTRELRIRN